MQTVVNWHGYNLTVYDPNRVKWNDVGAVYIFARKNLRGGWDALYVGKAESMAVRMGSHERWQEAVRRGAIAIHAIAVQTEADRARIEALLIKLLQPPMNQQQPRGLFGSF